MFLQQFLIEVEFQFDLDLLEAFPVAHHHFADKIYIVVIFIFHAEVVIQIQAAFDDLSAAVAFHFKNIISFSLRSRRAR